MRKRLITIILSVVLVLCLIFLGMLVYSLIPKECEHHFCDKTPIAATCYEKGYTLYKCKACDYTFEADFVAPTGHSFENEITEPLCDSEGYTTHTCTSCGIIEIDSFVPAKGHDYSKQIIAPTCETQGCTVNSCKNCDFETRTDYIKPNGHDKVQTVVAPTCESEGYTLSTCKNCDYEYKNSFVDPTGHSIEKTSTVAPTCSKGGYSKYECSKCNYEYTSDYTNPSGHSLSRTVTDPTCTSRGYSTYSCSKCDYSYVSDYTSPTEHTLSKRVTAPTCTSRGYSTYSCANCNYSYVSDYTNPTGHSLSKTVTNPTCTAQGYSKYECSKCDHEYISDYTNPKGHKLSSNVTAPTCTSSGYTTYECDDCDYNYTSNVTAPTEHIYEKTYIRPNIEKTGYTIYECIVCGGKHNADYVFYSDIFSGSAGKGEGSLALGVDVSHHSYDVDFEALRANGVDFVILRVGYNTSLDTKFEEYYEAAREAGLDIGVYFFTLAENKDEAKADAARVATWLDGKTFEYPIFYDIEDDPHYSGYAPSTFSEEQIMEIAHTFMTEMVNYGYYPGLYTNNNFLYNVFNNEKALRLYDVWYARYTTPTDSLIEEYSKTYSMWQYEGNVSGYANGAISGMCDVNYAFKDYPEIIKKYGFNGYE